MKRQLIDTFANQHGSVINVALLILILIFLIGIGLNKISTTDIKIAGNMKTNTTTFYEADAGLDAAGEMIEQNLACITGFTDTGSDGFEIIGDFYVNNIDFSHNVRKKAAIPGPDPTALDTDGDLLVDFYYPPNYGTDTDPHTTFSVGGASRFSKGSAIQMAAGYEGLGKGSASGGASVIFDVYAQRIGFKNSSATHFMQWVHILGSSGDCNF